MDAIHTDFKKLHVNSYFYRIENDPTNYMLYLCLSHQYLRLYRFQEASRACLIALKYLGATPNESTNQKYLLSSQPLERLIYLYHQISQINLCDNILVLESLSLALSIYGNTNEALALSQIINSIKTQPQKNKCDSNLDFYISLGESLLHQKRWQEALKVYQSALDIAPESKYLKNKVSEMFFGIDKDVIQPNM